jgi:hypothetical protein
VFVSIALGLLALLATGIVVFVFDVIVDLGTALAVGAALLVLLVTLMLVVPRLLLASADRTSG